MTQLSRPFKRDLFCSLNDMCRACWSDQQRTEAYSGRVPWLFVEIAEQMGSDDCGAVF